MRTPFLLSFIFMSVVMVSAQAPTAPAKPPEGAQPKPAPTTPPATTTPAQPRRAPATSARAGMAITVTDPRGATLGGIRVSLSGATTRNGETDPSGNLNFTGLMAGTYRLRFDGDNVISFEREVTLRSGQVLDVDVSLNPAPEPPAPAPAAAQRRSRPLKNGLARRASRRRLRYQTGWRRNSSAESHGGKRSSRAAATSGRR